MPKKYKSRKCDCCGQTTTYRLAIDRGTTDIVKAMAVAIKNKGKNKIHPRNEMEVNRENVTYREMVMGGVLSSNHVGNLSRPRFHGLIAKIEGSPGSYCITRKGSDFLNGREIPEYAIVSKVKGKQIGYWKPEEYSVTINDLRKDDPYWEGMNYRIRNGRIITDNMDVNEEQGSLV